VLEKNNGQFPFSADEMEKVRTNKEVFLLMTTYFFPRLLKKKFFGKQTKVHKVSNVVTVATEANILLNLHNRLEHWVDQYRIDKAKLVLKDKDGNVVLDKKNKPKRVISEVPTVYTRSTQGNDGFENGGSGWSKDGIRKYNELCKVVVEERNEGDALEAAFLHERKGGSTPPVKATKKKSQLQSPEVQAEEFMEYSDDSSLGSQDENGSDSEAENHVICEQQINPITPGNSGFKRQSVAEEAAESDDSDDDDDDNQN